MVLRESIELEKDWKYQIKEHYPLLTDENQLKGTELVFRFSRNGNIKAIEIPNKELMYN